MVWQKGRVGGAIYSNRKRKSASTDDGDSASKVSKADEREEELLKIVDQLTTKHLDRYTAPQLRLWAKYIQSKRHDSYEELPNITGTLNSHTSSRKVSLSDVLELELQLRL